MNLQREIYSKLKEVEPNTFFIYFPTTFKYRVDKGIVFDLTNSSNTNTFEGKEVVKEWTLEITLNYHDYDELLTLAEAVKTAIYSIESDRASIVSFISQDHDYIDELKCYQYNLQFNIR